MKKIIFLIVIVSQFALSGFSQVDSLHRYTDAEVIKLTNHVKNLEKRTAAYNASQYDAPKPPNNAAEQKILSDIATDSLHRYTDANVIKLAKYIKYLEKIDSLNTVAIAKVKVKAHDDSLATIAAIAKAKGGDEVLLGEGQDIDKFVKYIYFDFNSAVLTKESSKPLDDVAAILMKYNKLNFVVEGHTDSVGTPAYNLNLSKRRAESVKQYFVSKGVPAPRISSIGYGKAKPIDTNQTEQGRAKNRRVAIKAIKPKK